MIDLRQGDCMIHMKSLEDKSIDMICTDIPYGECNKKSHMKGQNLDKGKANTTTFELTPFLKECRRICRGTVVIFCGLEQFSAIFSFMNTQMGGGVLDLLSGKRQIRTL